jgi:hypothetical protein
MEMYESDVDGKRQLVPATTAPASTFATMGDSHEAGGARRPSYFSIRMLVILSFELDDTRYPWKFRALAQQL